MRPVKYLFSPKKRDIPNQKNYKTTKGNLVKGFLFRGVKYAVFN